VTHGLLGEWLSGPEFLGVSFQSLWASCLCSDAASRVSPAWKAYLPY